MKNSKIYETNEKYQGVWNKWKLMKEMKNNKDYEKKWKIELMKQMKKNNKDYKRWKYRGLWKNEK